MGIGQVKPGVSGEETSYLAKACPLVGGGIVRLFKDLVEKTGPVDMERLYCNENERLFHGGDDNYQLSIILRAIWIWVSVRDLFVNRRFALR